MRYSLKSGAGELEVKWEIFDESQPTLIFLHDSLGCIQLWRDFPLDLAKATGCNYLVYDRLGYGQSSRSPGLPERPDHYLELEAIILIELINDLQIADPILFGHSDGGSIALITAAKAPSLIKGVISEGAHVFVEEITLEGIQSAQISYQSTKLRDQLSKYHGDRVDDIFKAWTAVWQRESYREWNIEGFLSAITCPTLVIQGEKDEYGSLQQVQSIVRQVSGWVEKRIVVNVGHTPHKEDKLATLESCKIFIANIKEKLSHQ